MSDVETAWRRFLGPLLDAEKALAVLGLGTREALHDLSAQGALIALPDSDGEILYPAFQFDRDGRPYPEVARVLEVFARVVHSPYTVAFWFRNPQDLLEGETPADWLRSRRPSSLLLAAAQRTAGELAPELF